jgi:hypothetical protein
VLSDWLVPPHVRFLARSLRGRERRSARMRFLRDLTNWTVPANLQRVLLGLAYSVTGLDVADNGRLRNRYAGRRCFVIGNGPSLGAMDLTPLAGEITIGANSFYKHRDAERVGLTFLCIGDEQFMIDEPRAVDWHRIIAEKLPRTGMLLNPRARVLVEKYGLYADREVFYFRRGVVSQYAELVDFDLTKPINVGNTTGTQLAIPLAVYLGCTEIILLGFDCNWLESYTGSYHFYATHDQFPEFDALKTDDRWGRYEDHLIFALRDFEAHRLIAERTAQLGVTVRNATAGGLLDMYPRVRFEDCVARV